jgi:hypothetical protein
MRNIRNIKDPWHLNIPAYKTNKAKPDYKRYNFAMVSLHNKKVLKYQNNFFTYMHVHACTQLYHQSLGKEMIQIIKFAASRKHLS